MYNVNDMSWMLKSMSIHQKDSKGTIKPNFGTSCLAFRGSISTIGNVGMLTRTILSLGSQGCMWDLS